MKQTLLLAAMLLAASGPAVAEEAAEPAPEFDVELIVFRHLTPDDSEPPAGPDLIDPETQEVEEETPVLRRRFTPLTTDQLRLGAESQYLLGSRDWSPILHYGWRQPILNREKAPAVTLAGNRLGAYASGDVRISLERFLRLELDLQMDPGTGLLYRLKQSRRLRSGELHYFDHPQFGILVLVSRTDTPTPREGAANP